MIKCSNITWKDGANNGSVHYIYGSVNGITIFNACRFISPKFPDEKWLMNSNIIPMEMIKSSNLDELKIEVEGLLNEFLNKIVD